jgi:chloride channel protein, CIC family
MYGVGYPVMFKTTAGDYAIWFLIVLALGKILATSVTMGIGGSGGIFAPSLFIGVTTGMAYGDIVDHLFGAGAGQPALYAVVAMGAVFTAAARAPLTSLASVVEMTGDFSLTLPVMLAVAIATTVSRSLSYGTIYTTKLLRRGIDIDRAAPWRALADLKIADVMRPFRPALPAPPDAKAAETTGRDGGEDHPDQIALAGTVADRHDVQTLFASESLGQALRQLGVHGRDGLPVVSPDSRELEGWVTSEGVLRALAHRVAGTAAETAHAQAAADGEPDDAQAMLEHPPVPLPGYYVAEITITENSPAAGRKLGDVSWPPASVPVLLLRGGSLTQPDRETTLAPSDRVSLLIPAAQDTEAGTR